jgi:hypothetical protein
MPDVQIVQPAVLDLLPTAGAPALSSTNDVPIIETKPDAQNEGKPPELPKAAPAEPEKVEEGKTLPESATGPESKPSASDEPKQAKGVQKRLDELTKQREEERARAEKAEQLLERMTGLVEQLSGKKEPTTPEPAAEGEPVKPNRNDYPDPDAWESALVDYADKRAAWTAKREVETMQRQQREESQAAAIEQGMLKARDEYAARVQEAKTKIPDYDEVANSPDVSVPIPVAHAIINSEHGPQLQYYLAKHPERAQALFNMTPPQQLIALGLMVAEMQAPVKPPVSAAPRPISPIASPGESSLPKSLEDMSMEEYAAKRKDDWRKANTRH